MNRLDSTHARTRVLARSIVLLGRGDAPLQLPGDLRLSARAHLYFAYGADLCEPLLRRRCPDVRAIGRASLGGFALAFAGTSRTWAGATLTLVPTGGARVQGVLYAVSQLSLGELDRIQGCPRVYERVTVQSPTLTAAAPTRTRTVCARRSPGET